MAEELKSASDLYWQTCESPAPSPEKIAKHVARYGDEGVDEVLRVFGATEKTPTSLRAQGSLSRRSPAPSTRVSRKCLWLYQPDSK